MPELFRKAPPGAPAAAPARAPGVTETLNGVLEKFIFLNEENGYCVAELQTGSRSAPITITGELPGVQCGETLMVTGEWMQHATYGSQFKVKAFKSTLPSTVHGIRKYLASGLVEGIGEVYAERIVAKFGADTLRVISEQSGRLREVPGIGRTRVKSIKAAWDAQQAERDVMMFLQTYGVTTSLCVKLVRQYGANAKALLQKDPYRVAREVQGIGFLTADKIARNLGLGNDSPARLDAGLLFALEECAEDGHTCWPVEELVERAAEMLEVSPNLLPARVTELTANGAMVKLPQGLLQLPVYEKAERAIAESVHRLSEAKSALPPIAVEKAVAWAQDRAGFAFAPEQSAGLVSALKAKFSVLTGGPGTGKTTILRALADILRAKKARLLLAAPTGRAAQRLGEAARAHASTIHRLLKFDATGGGFTANAGNPLECDFLVVDESSMLDARLAAALLRAVPPKAHVLLVGDADQLPSVGAGHVLKDLIASGRVAVTKLEKIFRQGERSGIVTTAHGILHGNATPPPPVADLARLNPAEDVHFLRAPDPEKCVEAVARLCRDFLPKWYDLDPVMDVQVLAPMHKGVGGISNLNHALQAALNPHARGVPLGGARFQIGDKVIQLRNNYDLGLFNGDLGRVTTVNPHGGTLAANFDGETIDFDRAALGDLAIAYTISIHKSQGSEFPVVVIPLLKQHYIMLQRNLLYTALTRGRKKVFLVGDPEAYTLAVRRAEATQRRTDLERKLKE
ncbi:MAG TPA: ATP-dependent RecD-like DNA helicase [Opitutales bacterium]|nr:ATP-dependent RecD-like DNA helicase [Opitutales bacterium]